MPLVVDHENIRQRYVVEIMAVFISSYIEMDWLQRSLYRRVEPKVLITVYLGTFMAITVFNQMNVYIYII